MSVFYGLVQSARGGENFLQKIFPSPKVYPFFNSSNYEWVQGCGRRG